MAINPDSLSTMDQMISVCGCWWIGWCWRRLFRRSWPVLCKAVMFRGRSSWEAQGCFQIRVRPLCPDVIRAGAEGGADTVAEILNDVESSRWRNLLCCSKSPTRCSVTSRSKKMTSTKR